MRSDRETWPLSWTTTPRAAVSPITIFDLAELRAVVDTLRIAAGLRPMSWAGRGEGDPTFAAGLTLIRAVHFTQLREAIAGLYGSAGLEPPPDFSAGPVVPGSRPIALSDLRDPRAWVERYETLRPALAARVVRVYDAYTDPTLDATYARGNLTELWDGAGFGQYCYDRNGQLSRQLRVLDSYEYWTSYEYDPKGRLVALTFPDGERVS